MYRMRYISTADTAVRITGRPPWLTPIMAWCQAKPYSYSSEFPEAYFRQLACYRSLASDLASGGSASTCRLDLSVR